MQPSTGFPIGSIGPLRNRPSLLPCDEYTSCVEEEASCVLPCCIRPLSRSGVEQPLGALEVVNGSVGENNQLPPSPDVVPDVADAGNRGRFGGLGGATRVELQETPQEMGLRSGNHRRANTGERQRALATGRN